MSNPLPIAAAHTMRAACAAALAAAVSLSGCGGTRPGYVTPTATTAAAARHSEQTAPRQSAQGAGAREAAPSAQE